MATYERNTAAPVRDVLRTAEEVLSGRLPIHRTSSDAHSVTLEGGDGKVRIVAHRHGLATTVQASTDQLRTSRLDLDVQYFMAKLPYEPGDANQLH
ncbi:MAG TPA: hypothetical protein VF021_06165 [Longimicrobiales bacterium]